MKNIIITACRQKNLKSLSFHGWDKDPLLNINKNLKNSKQSKKNTLVFEIKLFGFKYIE